MSPEVISWTRESLLARRAQILADIPVTVETLNDLADRGQLVGSEWDAFSELEKIDFLLGGDN